MPAQSGRYHPNQLVFNVPYGQSTRWVFLSCGAATMSPAELTYLPTGQKILLKGLDDAQKLKSVKAKKGYFKYLWFEEASEFGGMDEIRNVEQSVLRGGDKFVEFITYNPPK